MLKARKVVVAIALTILALTLAACSSSEGSDPSVSSSSQKAFTPQDAPDPGEDQLGNIRVGRLFAGALLKASWKFPTSYEQATGDTTRAYSEDEHFRISVQAGSGDQARAASAMANAQRQATAKGQKTSLHTVSVKGREFAVLVQDTPEAAILTYAHAPAGDSTFYIVQLAADTSLADVPKKQLDAFQQTLGSLEFERR